MPATDAAGWRGVQGVQGGGVVTIALETTHSLRLLRARWRQLCEIRANLDREMGAVRNGLLMAGDSDVMLDGKKTLGRVGRTAEPSPYTYTEREAKAAHALHAAGEDSEWVQHGERAYQREKKRAERAREAS
jgi:hypothetical protein